MSIDEQSPSVKSNTAQVEDRTLDQAWDEAEEQPEAPQTEPTHELEESVLHDTWDEDEANGQPPQSETIDLIDPEDRVGPGEVRPESSKALPRLLVGCAGGGVAALFIFFMVGGFGGDKPPESPYSAASNPVDTPKIEENQDKKTIEELKLKGALGKQADQFEAKPIGANPPNPSTKTATPPPPTVKPIPRRARTLPPRPVTQSARIQPVVQSARSIPVARPSRVAQSFSASPVSVKPSTSTRRLSSSGRLAQSTKSTQPEEDPTAAWERQANLGSFAAVSSSNVSTDTTSTNGFGVTSATNDPGYTPAVYSPDSAPTGSNSGFLEAPYAASDSTSGKAFETLPEADTQAQAEISQDPLNSSTTKPIAAGTEAKAKLKMAIIWNQDIDISNEEFLAELSEPMGSIPEGSIITLKPTQISQSGLIRLSAVRITVEGQERPIPDGIQVITDNGGLIQASEERHSSGFGGNDFLSVLLRGAKGATQSLEGQEATDYLLSRAEGREQTVQSQKSPFFKVPEGMTIKLIVTQSVSI